MAFTERSMDSIKGKNTLKREPVNELHITVFENHIKVSFNVAIEASSFYIFSGQKLIKKARYGQFGEFLKT